MKGPRRGDNLQDSGVRQSGGTRAQGRMVMLGSAHTTRRPGGIRSVIEMYRQDGLFERWNIRYIGTHEYGGTVRKLLVASGAWLTFMALLLRRKIDLVHAHTSIKASFWRKCLFIVPAFWFRVPVIVHLHGGGFIGYFEQCGAFRQCLMRRVLDRADAVIVLTDTWRRKLERYTNNGHLVTIPNPVCTEPLDCASLAERDNHALLFVGKLETNKGIFELLDALRVVREAFPSVSLRCAGIGNIQGVEARIRELGLENNVSLLGWIRGREKDRQLCHASVVVLPSYWEGLPMSLLEAMSQGIPVVSTVVGGIPDAVQDGVEGFLVAPGDPKSLAAALIRILGDDSMRREMGRRARKRVLRDFSLQQVMPRLEQLYNELGMASHQQPARATRKTDAVGEESS